ISTTRTSPASPPGAHRRGLPTYAPRSALILPIRTGRGPVMTLAAAHSPPCCAPTCCTSRLGSCHRICSPAPAASCARAAVCSSTVRSSAVAPTPRRDLDELNALARDAGLTPAEILPMPANNLVLAFGRALGHN